MPLATAEDTAGDAAPSCTDGDGDPLTYAIAGAASHGTASIVAGQLHYVPAADYHGPDSFTYKANDGTVDSSAATVTVTVSSVNDAPVCAGVPLATAEDTAGDAAPSCTDGDGDPLTYAIAGAASHGTASIVAGQLHYVPAADYHGPDSFTYKANDGTVDSSAATVTVTVSSVNDAPVATADSYSTPKNTTKVVAAPGVLANDTDADGDSLTAIKLSDPAHGTVTLGADGAISYVPTTNYIGPDSFTYKANDGTADSTTVTVSLTVSASNSAPVCAGVPLATAEDTAGDAAPSCTDGDGDPLTYAIAGAASHGTASIVAGQLHYVPAADYHGPDSFTYKANDGTVDSSAATVTVTVSSVNDAPVCAGVPLATAEDTAGDAAPSCTDGDGDPLTYAIAGAASHGTASIVAGQLHYVPAADYHGPDSFTYKANDGTVDSSAATVTVTVSSVNDAPVATADSYSTPKNTTKVVAAPGVLANDTDPDGDSLTAIKLSDPAPRHRDPRRRRGHQLRPDDQLRRSRQLHLQGQRRDRRLHHRDRLADGQRQQQRAGLCRGAPGHGRGHGRRRGPLVHRW